MSISSTTNRVSYNGDGSSVNFAVPFPFHAKADLVVVETIIATGVQTTKTLTTHYTITGTADSLGHYPNGGTVVAVTAPAATVRWTIYRDPTLTQGVDLVEGDDLPVESAVEFPLDRLTMIAQRNRDLTSRSLRQPDGDSANIDALPAKVDRASKYLTFDADGDPIAAAAPAGTTAVSVFMATVLDDTTGSAVIQTILNDATAETTPATGDLLPFSDVSAGGGRAITVGNLLKVIDLLTQKTLPTDGDWLLAYDSASGAAKKVSPSSLASLSFSTGDVKLTLKTTADTGWVLMNDTTIGNATSGATGRANADTSALFTLLWNNTADADCVVSTGRGANAAADYAANKTIALPKALGRALATYGSGSGLTARALAKIVGEEAHTQTEAEMAAHAHAFAINNHASGTSSPSNNVGDSGTTYPTNSKGSGTAFNVMQPTVFLNVMIKL